MWGFSSLCWTIQGWAIQQFLIDLSHKTVLFFHCFMLQDVWSVWQLMGKAKAGVMYFLSWRQYLSRLSLSLTTCSVVLMPHQALTTSCNCRPLHVLIELTDTKLTAYTAAISYEAADSVYVFIKLLILRISEKLKTMKNRNCCPWMC